MKDKENKRWCSKHQRVHGEDVNYCSCRFPNSKEENNKKRRRKYIRPHTPYSFSEEY